MSLLQLAIMALAAHASHTDQITSVVALPDVTPPQKHERGKGTWYGDGNWHGDITANGERFDPVHTRTCANRTLPFNTLVFIVNRDSGQRNWCRINDRGPYPLHFIDGEWKPQVVREIYKDYDRLVDMSIRTMLGVGPKDQGRYNIDIYYTTPRHTDFSLETLDKQYL